MGKGNLLFVMADEHNARMLGCAGNSLVKTPNIDRLCERGTRFDAAYTNSPICAPARAALATGRYIHQTGYWDNTLVYDGRVESWGHVLRRAGVRVDSIGKLHFRNETDDTGFDRQHIPLHITNGIGMAAGLLRGQFPEFRPPKRERGPGPIVPAAGPGESSYIRYDRKIADRACAWIHEAARDAGRPWALFVSFVTPHYPLIVPAEFFNLYPEQDMPLPALTPLKGFVPHPWYERQFRQNFGPEVTERAQQRAYAAYLGLCTFMDAQVGRVLDALASSGLAENTRVIYTSDHGENAGARGLWGKSVMYEDSARIPLILSGPGVARGAHCETPVSLVDAFPSVLQALDVDNDADDLPGDSWYEIANRAEDPGRPVFSEYHSMGSPSALYLLRSGRFKLHHYVGYEPELFDVIDDPEETRNLAARPEFAVALEQCRTELRRILDPEAIDARAKADQKAFVEKLGGPEYVFNTYTGGKNFTEIPEDFSAAV